MTLSVSDRCRMGRCEVPLSSCPIRNTNPDAVCYYGLVNTELDIPTSDILRNNGYRRSLYDALLRLAFR